MFKDKIKALREERRLTKKAIAEQIGISERAYITYEYGQSEPKMETIVKLADFYGVTTDYLLGRDQTDKLPNPLDMLGLGDLDKALVQAYIALKPAERTQFVELLTKIADGAKLKITLDDEPEEPTPRPSQMVAVCSADLSANSDADEGERKETA